MSVLLFAAAVLAFILGGLILLIMAVLGALVVHASFDRRASYSFFAGRVVAPKAEGENNHPSAIQNRAPGSSSSPGGR